MSEISNSALTNQSWKNYQDRYDQIDWTDQRGHLSPERVEAIQRAIDSVSKDGGLARLG
jgi:hypothetical protein